MERSTPSLLTSVRKSRGLSLLEVAKSMDVTEGHISRVERGAVQASPDLANRLAQFFNNAVTRDQILFPGDYAVRGKKPVRSERPQEGCDLHAGN